MFKENKLELLKKKFEKDWTDKMIKNKEEFDRLCKEWLYYLNKPMTNLEKYIKCKELGLISKSGNKGISIVRPNGIGKTGENGYLIHEWIGKDKEFYCCCSIAQKTWTIKPNKFYKLSENYKDLIEISLFDFIKEMKF